MEKATRSLPEDYHQISQFDLNENRGLGLILNLVGLGLLFGVGALFLESLIWLRPEYLSSENILIITGLREFWRGVLLLAVSVFLVIVLREGFHGLVLWFATGQLPKLGGHSLFSAAVSPEWYLPRPIYLWLTILPLVAITVLGLAAVTLVPLNWVPGVMLVVALNAALALGDIVTLAFLLRQPSTILFQDLGDGVVVYGHQPDGHA